MIQFQSAIQSNRRRLFRGLLLMSLVSGSTAVRADQPVALPPSIMGDSRPVLILGGIESPSSKVTTAPLVQSTVSTQHFVKQESTAQPTVTQNNPPKSIPAIPLQPATKATKPTVTLAEETVSIIQAADEPIQRRPSQAPTSDDPFAQSNDPFARPSRPRIAEPNPSSADQPGQRADRAQSVPRPQQDRSSDARNSRGPDNRGPDNRGPDNRGPDNRGPDNRGPDNRGPDNRGPDNRGPDNRGPDNRGLEWKPSNPVGGTPGGMIFVPGNQPARPMLLQGIGAPGMDPNMHLARPAADPDKLIETPVVKRLLELMEQNMELKAQLKIQKVEMEARERVQELEAALRSKEERAHQAAEEVQDKRRQMEIQRNELKEMERKLDQQRRALEQQHEALSQKLRPNHPIGVQPNRQTDSDDAKVMQQKRIEVHVVDQDDHENGQKSQALTTKLAAELKSMTEKLAKSEAAYKEASVSKEALAKRLAELENRSRLLEEKAKSLIEQKSGETDNQRSMAEKRLREREQARQKEIEREEQARARAEEEKQRAEVKQQEARAKEAAKQQELKQKEEAKKEAERKEETRKKEEEKKDKKKDRDDE